MAKAYYCEICDVRASNGELKHKEGKIHCRNILICDKILGRQLLVGVTYSTAAEAKTLIKELTSGAVTAAAFLDILSEKKIYDSKQELFDEIRKRGRSKVAKKKEDYRKLS